MTSALMRKELRECAGLAALGLAGLAWLALSAIGISPFGFLFSQARGGAGTIPFIDDSFTLNFALAAGALVIALGFKQALSDQAGSAHLFLLHRPVKRQTIFLTKVLVGLALYFFLAALPILVYSLWAASAGTHASPFAWSMTTQAWITWLALHLVYLGAFLSGIRPAAWTGTRVMPLAASCALAGLAIATPVALGLVIMLSASAVFVMLILYVTETRDFA
jgi:hypothetical protein